MTMDVLLSCIIRFLNGSWPQTAARELRANAQPTALEIAKISMLMADFLIVLAGDAAMRWANFVLGEPDAGVITTDAAVSNALCILDRAAVAPHKRVGKSASVLYLSGRNLRGQDFTRLNLLGANLRNSDLRDARLTGLDLTDAIFAGAQLDGARFDGAILFGVDLTGAEHPAPVSLARI